ncbi:MAG TPA: HD domain-containing protein [Acidimicrobiales bacterium]|nr:HD domain-containing protein [Acidimicrobiales bacterium]
MLLDAIDHVQLAMPPGGEELATWFYEGVLGVPRVPKPPHLAVRGGCWFERGALRIHLGVQDDFVPATKAHPAFAVVDLDRLEASIQAQGLAVRREPDPLGPDVLYVDDPFGNRIELRPARGVEDKAAYAHTVEEVAREAVGDRLAAELAFVQELDRLKTVQRQSFVLDALRRENSAEHSWHVAMLAAVLAEHATDDVDISRVLLLLLVHDVVEIDAGDTGIYDDDNHHSKQEREEAAADRLFGLLPADVGGRLREAWDEYEHGDTPEARFARVFDRLSPLLLNLSSGGIAWRRWGVDAVRVRQVLAPIGEGAPELGRFVEAMVDRAVGDGLLPAGGSGLILP